jgi:hypothetical protein
VRRALSGVLFSAIYDDLDNNNIVVVINHLALLIFSFAEKLRGFALYLKPSASGCQPIGSQRIRPIGSRKNKDSSFSDSGK